jgi:hypothetical protein
MKNKERDLLVRAGEMMDDLRSLTEPGSAVYNVSYKVQNIYELAIRDRSEKAFKAGEDLVDHNWHMDEFHGTSCKCAPLPYLNFASWDDLRKKEVEESERLYIEELRKEIK